VWLHGYLLPDADFRTVCRTFQRAFPEATLWNAGPFDYLLIGVERPLHLDPARLSGRIRASERNKAGQWTGISDPLDLQRHFLLDAASLKDFAGAGRVQHDRDPFLEFTVPHGLYGEAGLLDVSALLAVRHRLPLSADDPLIAAQLEERRAALYDLERALLGSDLEAVDTAALSDPQHPFLRERQAHLFHARALELAAQGDYNGAGQLAFRVTLLAPDSLPAWRLRSLLLHEQGDISGAVSLLRQARGAQPWNVYATLELARYLRKLGRERAAQNFFEEVRAQDPTLLR
jgi:tetratricopeptide (TPR) repeat protein